MIKRSHSVFKFFERRLKKIADLISSKEKTNQTSSSPSLPYAMTNPFRTIDLSPIPTDWSLRGGPDFVGIGAPKAGTSWWYTLLLDHLQIVGHRLEHKAAIGKELNYFLHFGYQGISKNDMETYLQAFAAPKGSICGEFSVLYFCYPLSIKYLAETAPNTKIILMLRNPIDRTLSHLNQLFSKRLKNFMMSLNEEQLYMLKAYSIYTEAFYHSLYSKSASKLLYYFDRDQILVLQYEQCQVNPEKNLANTYRFLDVDNQYQSKMITQPVNQYPYVVDPLKLEERQRLADYFVDDVQAVVKLFPQIDLSFWSDFKS